MNLCAHILFCTKDIMVEQACLQISFEYFNSNCSCCFSIKKNIRYKDNQDCLNLTGHGADYKIIEATRMLRDKLCRKILRYGPIEIFINSIFHIFLKI